MGRFDDVFAAIGAVSVAYHEVFRGRRVGVCMSCGRLNHATSERCLCGGEVDPVDDPVVAQNMDPAVANRDPLRGRRLTIAKFIIGIVLGAAAVPALHAAVSGGSHAGAFALIAIGVVAGWLG